VGIYRGDEMNLVGKKRKHRWIRGCRIQEIEVGVRASQVLNCIMVSIRHFGHFVGAESYLCSGFVLWDHHCRVGEGLSDLQGTTMKTSRTSVRLYISVKV